jgi:two-component system, LytTR family, sensor kinase
MYTSRATLIGCNWRHRAGTACMGDAGGGFGCPRGDKDKKMTKVSAITETLDVDGWAHRLPHWQREEPVREEGWRGRLAAALRSDRLTIYVATLLLLWVSYFVLRTGIALIGETAWSYALPRLFISACGFAMTLGLGLAIQRLERISLGAAIAATVVAIFAGAWLFVVLNYEIEYFLYPENRAKAKETAPNQFWWSWYLDLYLFVAWACLHYMVRYFVSLQRQRQATLRAVALAQEAKLEVLRYQLNPHFLFNTLNAISTLVLQKKTELAEETIDRLSTFLRHTLASDPKAQVTLAQELEAIELYLQIQQVRFGKRMSHEFRITPEARKGCVPSLILQPIVENAVKYAVTPQQEGGRVEIHAWQDGGQLIIEVRDTGPGVADPQAVAIQGTGVGLANCRARLREFYGAAAVMTLGNCEPHGLCVRMVIPYQEGSCDE